MPLMDDDFFAVVMQDKGAFQVMLRILTGREDLTVTEVRTQYAMRNLVGHSAILDGYAEDAEHKVYNVEVQVRDTDYHEKRVRFYQSNMDLAFMEKGTKYEELPDLYLIFISKFDIFQKSRNHYEIKRRLDEFDDEIPNGVHELYFNTAVQDGTRVSELLQYFKNSDSGNDSFGDLSRRVKFYKETNEGVSHMCEAVKVYGYEQREAGVAEGKTIGLAEGKAVGEAKKLVQMIKTLMQSAKCSLEDALQMTGSSLEEYEASIALLATTE